MSCGTCITAAIKSDGSLWACGENKFYGLIDASFKQDVGVLTRVMDGCCFSALDGDACTIYVVKNDGTLYGWGGKDYLGIGTEDGET